MFRTCWRMYLCAVLAFPVLRAVAEDAQPYPRVSEEGFKARLGFFNYDPAVPLNARVVREWSNGGLVKQKFVFRGAQGFMVPGYFEKPKSVTGPAPLVLLLHGWSGSKDNWWDDSNMISGGQARKAMFGLGCAVLALDASTHGERNSEIDYQHVNPFDDPKGPPQHNYFTFAEIAMQTVKDYRRALDYMAQRGDVDMSRIALLGYSMGGMDAFYLLSVEPRIKVAAAAVPPLFSDGYGPASPVDYSWGIGDKPFLMMAGKTDELGDPARVDATFKTYIARPTSKLIWYDAGHELPRSYVDDVVEWFKGRL